MTSAFLPQAEISTFGLQLPFLRPASVSLRHRNRRQYLAVELGHAARVAQPRSPPDPSCKQPLH